MVITTSVFAGGIYQKPAAFLLQIFDNKPPKSEVIWLSDDLKKNMADILGHAYKGLRIRYWKKKDKTVWILDEIGKEKPITVGFVINQHQIELVKILAFRESRGWEVRHDFFTNQFQHAQLKTDNQLDKTIDNISGATLSVRAVTKLARIALLLDAEISR